MYDFINKKVNITNSLKKHSEEYYKSIKTKYKTSRKRLPWYNLTRRVKGFIIAIILANFFLHEQISEAISYIFPNTWKWTPDSTPIYILCFAFGLISFFLLFYYYRMDFIKIR